MNSPARVRRSLLIGEATLVDGVFNGGGFDLVVNAELAEESVDVN
jgi:hypothetical protein